MPEPLKGNEEIRADERAFLAAVDRARAVFGRIDGVVGVGFGHKQVGGRFAEEVVIQVFVRDKKPEDALAPDERIPPTFEGYRTDVRRAPRAVDYACDDVARYEVMKGGIQIQVGSAGDTGTLGCIVRKRGDPGRENVYLLSNMHVLYAEGGGNEEAVYQPFPPSGNGRSIATIVGPAFRRNMTYTGRTADPDVVISDEFYLDCAIARINIDCKCPVIGSTCTRDDVKFAPEILGLQVRDGSRPDLVDTLSDVRNVINDTGILTAEGTAPTAGSPRVFKVGRTTGRTVGVVRSVTAHPLDTNFNPRHNVIEIEFDTSSESTGRNCKGDARFADHGDSGSLVVDENGQVIGLVYGGMDEEDNPGETLLTFACHIVPVLDKLGICIPTKGGTSHGSDGALDGSGIVVHVLGDFEVPAGGGFAFASRSTGAARWPAPQPITDAERERLHAYRDELDSTAVGRELHATFAEVRLEIGYLVRNVRPVTVAWHRHKGPAFLTWAIKHLRGDAPAVPREIDGVTRDVLLERMGAVLAAHGSKPMGRAISRHGDALRALLARGDTVDEWLSLLREIAPADVAS